jgi:phosphomannomutase
MTHDPAPPGADEELSALLTRAREWISGDPDPETREQLAAAAQAQDLEELRAALAAPLAFGTAGLRGLVGPGPARMNRATVIRVTHGLADHLLRTVGTQRPVIVGFDARPDSARFARDTVAVLAAAGLPVAHFERPVPTPLVAHVARVRGAAGAVVITASHNPPAYNGYKVYGPDAIQIVGPDDGSIAAAAAAAPPAADVGWVVPEEAEGVEVLGEREATDYLDEVAAAVPRTPGRDPRIVYTPLHGVAGDLAIRALAAAGFHDVHEVASQAAPDGTFPTLAFPNPEEPGVLDAALARAAEVDAGLVLANDPDGDRLAVAVRDGDGYRTLTGNQIGVLLGDHLLRHTDATRPVVASSVVSSPMFALVAADHAARHETTLTGFKWICRAAARIAEQEHGDVVFGYEEALGYAVGTVVRDKDGISAAVTAAGLVRELAGAGRTLVDRLEELYQRHGLWVSHQHAVTLAGAAATGRVGAALEAASRLAGTRLAGRSVVVVEDHRQAGERPVWRGVTPLVELGLEGGARVLVRPSGTEPKVKVYVDLRAPRQGGLADQEHGLLVQADQTARDLLAAIGLG